MFDEICNSSWFVKTSIILFLNKSDLFRVSACRFFCVSFGSLFFCLAFSFIVVDFAAAQEKIERKVPLTDCFPFYTGSRRRLLVSSSSSSSVAQRPGAE